MATRLDATDAGFASRFAAALSTRGGTDADVAHETAEIIAAVRAHGDRALLDYTARFDRVHLQAAELRVVPGRIAEARAALPRETVAALELAASRIEAYHRGQLPRDRWYRDAAGVGLGERWLPVSSVGLYVPGGTAAYPSSVLMNAIPARVAGVERLVMVTPTPDGTINPAVLAAADVAGIDDIRRIGGAQAVAALAYGTESIAPVDKIVGPGNAWVAAAKRHVYGVVGIDSIAGPSEVLVVADGANDPRWIAADLLAQAEHDAAAQSILITDDPDFADATEEAVETLLAQLPRALIARQSWNEHGLIVVVPSLDAAPALVDRAAPEHLQIATSAPEAIADAVRHAGAIFLGRHTPEAMGDYLAGPNHVLPTARSARFSSGLSVYDFLKRTSMLEFDAASLAELGPAAVRLAKTEGFDAHALSVSMRLDGEDGARAR